ncbi:uncharacterized protein LOC142570455 [Dermacentor variabilis]|uniref:uncharacterized protein LOC142570455 n=1 Tax=Dermacentor variabilis TaxID=34621 RepID=UPI003F5C87C4
MGNRLAPALLFRGRVAYTSEQEERTTRRQRRENGSEDFHPIKAMTREPSAVKSRPCCVAQRRRTGVPIRAAKARITRILPTSSPRKIVFSRRLRQKGCSTSAAKVCEWWRWLTPPGFYYEE